MTCYVPRSALGDHAPWAPIAIWWMIDMALHRSPRRLTPVQTRLLEALLAAPYLRMHAHDLAGIAWAGQRIPANVPVALCHQLDKLRQILPRGVSIVHQNKYVWMLNRTARDLDKHFDTVLKDETPDAGQHLLMLMVTIPPKHLIPTYLRD